jgi:hypothetical protein
LGKKYTFESWWKIQRKQEVSESTSVGTTTKLKSLYNLPEDTPGRFDTGKFIRKYAMTTTTTTEFDIIVTSN